jgi:hypothetical protein
VQYKEQSKALIKGILSVVGVTANHSMIKSLPKYGLRIQNDMSVVGGPANYFIKSR